MKKINEEDNICPCCGGNHWRHVQNIEGGITKKEYIEKYNIRNKGETKNGH